MRSSAHIVITAVALLMVSGCGAGHAAGAAQPAPAEPEQVQVSADLDGDGAADAVTLRQVAPDRRCSGRTAPPSTSTRSSSPPGYRPALSYLRPLGALDDGGLPRQRFGLSRTHRGLAFVGVEFQRTFLSGSLHGVGLDARYVARRLGHSLRNGR